MASLVGYLLSLVSVLPAFSAALFFRLLGPSRRLHDLLGLWRSIVQVLATVTSPVRIGLMLVVLLYAFVAEHIRPTRSLLMMGMSVLGFIGTLQVLAIGAKLAAH